MKNAKQRFREYNAQQFASASKQLLAITLDRMDYPDYDPERAEVITLQMIASGQLAVAPEGMKGLCV